MLKAGFISAGALLCVACRPPEAPETLDDLASYLFEHTWDEDERYLQPGLSNLEAWLEDCDKLVNKTS